jgi:NADH-quinone oxidoreductase subunit C
MTAGSGTYAAADVAAAVGGGVARDVSPRGVDVPLERWHEAVAAARDAFAFTWFDALTAVDEGDGTFTVLLTLRRLEGAEPLTLRTRLDRTDTSAAVATGGIASITDLFAGAGWPEREAAEMFGLVFDGSPDPRRLLLHPDFEGAPLRKDRVLVARAARAWPGAKEPGESDADVAAATGADGGEGSGAGAAGGRSRRRRRAVPPGVPERGEDGRW